jgi:hypothetical protein
MGPSQEPQVSWKLRLACWLTGVGPYSLSSELAGSALDQLAAEYGIEGPGDRQIQG